jgi:glucosamine--fructose-6-phosphate aminotransferase (isomerizing)
MSTPIVETEIADQPAVVERLLREQEDPIRALADRLRARPPQSILIAARGSSDNAGRYAQHVFGLLCGLPVALATPSLLTLYHTPVRLQNTLVIGISQSGASPDIRAVIEDARRQQQPTVVITNNTDSPLAQLADTVIDLGAGPERSIAATKSYTSSLAAIAALAVALRDDAQLARELRAIPDAMAAQLDRDGAVGTAETWDRCMVAGRGAQYATAWESALKIKELSGIAAEPHSPADLLHGPIAVVGPKHPLLTIATTGPAFDGALEVVGAARDRGAPVLAITDRTSEARAAGADVLVVERVPDWLSPLVAIIPAQRLAVHVALQRGIDVDRPFGLSKVTETT